MKLASKIFEKLSKFFYHGFNSEKKIEDAYNYLKKSNQLKTIEKISRSKFICVESYRNNKEQFNLQCWALTAETIIDTRSWKYLFEISGYSGDFEFIFF